MKSKPILMGEVGLSHEGSLGNALALIQLAADNNLDIVKFQDHWADYESSYSEKMRIKSLTDKDRYSYWKRTEFSTNQWNIIYKYAKEKNIELCFSVFSPESFLRQKKLGNKLWKIGSGEMMNKQLLNIIEKEIGKDETIIISSGLSPIDNCYEYSSLFIEKIKQVYILDCISEYPCDYKDYDIKKWKYINELNTKIKFGLSDHSGEIWPTIYSWCKGSSLNEFHITFDKNMYGPDQKASLDRNQLKELSYAIKAYQAIFSDIEHTQERKKNKNNMIKLFGRSLGLKKSLKAGSKLNFEDFQMRKPSGGLSFDDISRLIGKKLIRDYDYLDLLNEEDLTD